MKQSILVAGLAILLMAMPQSQAFAQQDQGIGFVETAPTVKNLQNGVARWRSFLAKGGFRGWRAKELNQRIERNIRIFENNIARLSGAKRIFKPDLDAYLVYARKFFSEEARLMSAIQESKSNNEECEACRQCAASEGLSVEAYIEKLSKSRLEPIRLAALEISFTDPQNVDAALVEGVFYYPYDPDRDLVFEVKNTGDKAADEVEVRFDLNHGWIKSYGGDVTSCTWIRAKSRGQCGFVSIEPGQSKKIGVRLHVAGLTLDRETNYRDVLEIAASTKSYSIEEDRTSLTIPFKGCALKLLHRLGRANAHYELSKPYSDDSKPGLTGNGKYPGKRFQTPRRLIKFTRKTKSEREKEVHRVVDEMLANKGLDVYLRDQTGNGPDGGLQGLLNQHVEALRKTIRPGLNCPNIMSPDAPFIKRMMEFKERFKHISVMAERTRRQAQRERDAIQKTLREIGPNTGETLVQGEDANEGLKALERKTLTFSFNAGLRSALVPGNPTALASSKTVSLLSLIKSLEQIYDGTKDAAKLAWVAFVDVSDTLDRIENAAHLQVLKRRYELVDAANDKALATLRRFSAEHCDCKVPFQ